MFFTSEDDEGDFLSPGGSKLASVFGMDRASSQGGNESLTYTAPKQPKRKDTGGGESGAAQSTGVTSATVVHAYKLVDNQYASQGKVGAAILTNHAAHEYRILLYVSKQQQLTNVKITPTFAFNVQTNNYANFYDEARVNWSIMFTSAQDAEKFAKEVGLFKAVVAGGQLSTVVQQDMRMGEGGGLENGDSLETKYTGWLLANNTFGQVFDSNTSSDKLFRLKVGKGKVIKGWDQGMLGMRKGGKRLLVIPPGLAYGAQGVPDRVPANSTLIFEVEVVRVKLQKGEATAEATQPPVPAAVPAANPMPVGEEVPDVNLGDDVVKERSRSITEQLSHQSPKSDKAKLISRMAKMGQPMLPNMSGAVPAQPDSEEEPPSPQPTTGKPQLPSKPHALHSNPQPMAHTQVPLSGQPVAQPYAQPVPQPVAQPAMAPVDMHGVASAQPAFLQNLLGAQQLAVYQPQPTLLQQQQQQQQALLTMQQQQMGGVPMATSQPPGYMPQATPLSVHALAASSAGLGPSSSTSDAMAPLLLSETRQQNTEMRMAVGKMSDKVDRILEKMDTLSTQGGQHQPLPAPTMETSILLHNITRIIQENERLKKEVFERGEKIETQNDKIAELLQKNQRYVEKSNTLLEERNEGYKLTANQSQSRILALEQEKVQMATELSSTTAQLSTLQLELGELRKKEGALRQQLQSSSSSSVSHQEEVERLRLQRAEDEKKLADLTASLREEKTARKQIDGQLTAVQEELTDLKTTCSGLERNLNERKRKAAEERKKTEDEMEEVKAGYEKDIQVLREKLRKQRTNTDVEAADKIAKMEEEMAADWQAKCDKLVAAANDKHARQMALVKDDLEEAQNRATALEKKIQELRASSGSFDARIEDLQQQVEENAGFKEKYDSLRTQATAMKQRYEDRIAELDQEVETMGTRQQQLQQQLQQSKLQLQQQQQQQTAAVSGGSSSSADVATEVKKVMNSVYQSLRAEFEADENYTGSEVMSVILGVIKETTLKLVQQPQGPTTQEEEESEEEEEDEEDDEEEEEEEEEKEKQENQTPPTSELTSSALEDVASTTAPVMEASKSDAHSTQVPEIPAQPITRDEDNKNEDESTEETQAEDDLQRTAVHNNQSAQPSPPSSGPPADDDPAPPSEDLSTADSEAAAPPHSRGAETPAEDPQQIHPPPSETSSREDKSEKPAEPKADKPEETPPKTQHEVPVSAKSTAEKSSSGVSAERSSRSSAGAALPTLASREPPPLFDGEDNDDDSPLFGDDNMVADTLGPEVAVTPAGKEKTGGDKLTPRNDLLDDDLKPKPPPPLFGDDDDEDDLDWLS